MKAIASTFERPYVKTVGATFVLALATAAFAQVSFRLPFTPVPVTMQVFGVILSGLLLGGRLGALAQLQYIALGLAGAPVFAGWIGGPAALLGPSGGYIPGFVVGAYAAGFIFHRAPKQDMRHALFAGAVGLAAIYWCGVAWLAALTAIVGKGSPWLVAWLCGVAPFVGVDALKVALASAVATGTLRWK